MINFSQFVSFSIVSAVGWILDLLTFVLLVNQFNIDSFYANFISSYVGVTFVWFVSLNAVFNFTELTSKRFLFTYWGFQLLSILFYSKLLSYLIILIDYYSCFHFICVLDYPVIYAKIIMTPLNLITNFIFMKCFTISIKKNFSKVIE